ncbi:MAG: hypothetical protein OXL96_08715 [Candidatus Poribacteria bacterium]|nr:hypothetical protein [Candidatus Poribacteria bacterium]
MRSALGEVEGELEIVSVSIHDRRVIVKSNVKSSVLISALDRAGFGAELSNKSPMQTCIGEK